MTDREERVLPELDEPPSGGVYVDHDDEELTEEEIEAGNAEGEDE